MDSRSWSITKAEWDRLAPEKPRAEATPAKAAAAFLILAALTSAASIAWSIAIGDAWLIVAAALLSSTILGIALHTYRRARRRLGNWCTTHPAIWELHGCVCPWCQVRVDRERCPGHGFGAADQPTLIAYWEALATRDSSTLMRLADELRATARAMPDAASRTGEVFIRPLRAIAPGMFDAERSPLARASAAWPVSLALLMLLVLFAITLDALFGRRAAMVPLAGSWAITLIPMVAALSWSGWKPGPPRCAGCGHLCATTQPVLCPECGANLARRGAVERGAKARNIPWAYVPFALLIWVSPSITTRAIGALPFRARNAIYAVTLPPTNYFRTLSPATMTAAEATSAADLLIELVGRDRGRVFAPEFLPDAIAAGKVPPNYREKALRAMARARLDARVGEDGLVELSVQPSFGERILGFDSNIWIDLGGSSADGGRSWVRGCTLTLEPGIHELRARAWIVVTPAGADLFRIEFDDQATPLLTDPAMEAYELPLSTTVTIP